MSDSEPPDTVREPTTDQRLDRIDARLSQIENILTTIAHAMVEQGYTLRGHIRSHEQDSERERVHDNGNGGRQ